MVIAHFTFGQPGPGLLASVVGTVNGRASLTFVLVAGIGVTLLIQAKGFKTAGQTLLWRALILYVAGVAIQPYSPGPVIILQFYAFYYLLGWLVARLSNLALGALSALWLVVGCWAWWLYAPALTIADETTSISQHLAIIFYTGQYPLVTWGPIVCLGVLLGRLDWQDTTTIAVLTGCAASVVATVHIALAVMRSAQPGPGLPEWIDLVPHSHSISYLVEGYAVAVMVVGLCVLIAHALTRAGRYQLIAPLVIAGRQGLTLYLTHMLYFAAYQWLVGVVIDYLGAMRAVRTSDLLDFLIANHFWFDTAAAVICVGLMVVQANIWARFYPIGPFERFLRRPAFLDA